MHRTKTEKSRLRLAQYEGSRKTCDRAIWLEQGEIRAEGAAGLVVEEHLKAQGQSGGSSDE